MSFIYLSKHEEKILDGEHGEAKRLAMEILVKLGDINKADRLIEIDAAHISGISYKNIGDAGLEFLMDLKNLGAKFSILATTNPSGVDRFNILGVDEHFYKKQMLILNVLKQMGAKITCTCTPYYIGNLPYRRHVAFAESSATIFVNSVLGAYTNRESSISSIAAAIIGKTPLYGLHKEENRKPKIRVIVEDKLKGYEYYLLGYYIGKELGEIPIIENVYPNVDELKYLSAGLSVSSINIFHVYNLTLESKNYDIEDLEKIKLDRKTLDDTVLMFKSNDYEAICLGCPHLSMMEIKRYLRMKFKNEVLLFTNYSFYKLFKEDVRCENIKLIPDTCMVVSPLKYKTIATNSTKACFYLNLQGYKTHLINI